MSELVDARGLSCPQPVIMVMNRMDQSGGGEITVLVDAEVARENVSRLASSRGWTVAAATDKGGTFELRLEKK